MAQTTIDPMADLLRSEIPVRTGTRCRAVATHERPHVTVRCRRDHHGPDEGHVGCDGHWWLAWDEEGEEVSMREVGAGERIPNRWTPSSAQRRVAPYSVPWFLRARPEGF
jgi:hypothetical protein